MVKPMMIEKEWFRNVGTGNHPVTFLHEYAVGLIWDMLHANAGPVQLPTLDGSLSDDLLDGTDKVIIPDSLQSVAGYIPDISLLKDSRPIRVIEVVVTNPLPPDKVTAMRNLGVDVVQVQVRNEQELVALVHKATKANRRWFPKLVENHYKEIRSKLGVNWRGSRQYRALEAQRIADKAINDLLSNLTYCSPEVRRDFLEVVKHLDSLESLYPLHPDNPKKDIMTMDTRI